MQAIRPLLLVLGLTVILPAHGQAIVRKHLVTSLGFGGGMLDMIANNDSLSTYTTPAGAVRFAFGYALSDHWSIGFHYDRVGTDMHQGDVTRVRFTTYLLEAIWRPWTGRLAAFEVHGGFGPSIMSLRRVDERLPYRANVGVAGAGVRYLHLISNTIGFFVAGDVAGSSSGPVTYDNAIVELADGRPISLSWSSARLTTGVAVRF